MGGSSNLINCNLVHLCNIYCAKISSVVARRFNDISPVVFKRRTPGFFDIWRQRVWNSLDSGIVRKKENQRRFRWRDAVLSILKQFCLLRRFFIVVASTIVNDGCNSMLIKFTPQSEFLKRGGRNSRRASCFKRSNVFSLACTRHRQREYLSWSYHVYSNCCTNFFLVKIRRLKIISIFFEIIFLNFSLNYYSNGSIIIIILIFRIIIINLYSIYLKIVVYFYLLYFNIFNIYNFFFQ